MNVIKLFEFFDNNKRYLAYIKDNTLSFGYSKNNHIYKDLTNDELVNMKEIYRVLVGNKQDLVKISSSKIDNSIITFFYNPINKLYSFYEEKDNKLIKSSNNIISKLNILLNNHEGIMYSKKENSDDEKIYKIILKKGAKYLTIFTSAGLVLSYLPAMPSNNLLFKIDYNIDNLYKDPNLVYDNTSYDFKSVLAAIDSNSNLTAEEKEFLYGLKDEIDENIDYIDIDKLNNNLANLNINYNSETKTINNKKDILIDYNVTGSYTYMGINRNTIDLYDSFYNHPTCFANSDKSTLIHEINHLVNNKSALLSIPGYQGNVIGSTYSVFDVETNIMHEMVNELFSREYANGFNVDDSFKGYDNLMPIMYVLAEIIDDDTLRRYKYNSDDYYLNNYFKSLGVEDNYIYSLYKDLNLASSDILTDDEKKINNKEIYNIIKYIYEKKYNKDMDNDLVIISYLYKTDFSSDELNNNFEQYTGLDNIFSISPKGYLSKKYMNIHNEVKIYAYDDLSENAFKEIYSINDSNRYINNKIK